MLTRLIVHRVRKSPCFKRVFCVRADYHVLVYYIVLIVYEHRNFTFALQIHQALSRI